MSIDGIEKNIATLLEKAVDRFASNEMLYFITEDKSYTYRQLNDTVNQYAVILQKAGISKGDHFAMMLANGPEFIFVWLALAKIGAVAVPLNIRLQGEDLEYALNDSDSVGLVIADEYAPVFKQVKDNTPDIKILFSVGVEAGDIGPNLPGLALTAATEFSGVEVGEDDLISIQYTSGTTGFPKGCLLTHEYWQTLAWVAAQKMSERDVFFCVEPFYYMDPPWELLMCIMKGMKMVVARSYSPSKFMPTIRKYGITVSWALLSYWIFKQPEYPEDKENNLRILFSGAIPKGIHKAFEERFNTPLREGYGMTEIGPGIVMPLEDSYMSGSGSVGKPTAYRTVKIVDEAGQEVVQGETGELWVSGPGMFVGYYNKPEATDAAFSGEWFRTGDLFREDEQGYFYIVGRIKEMIKRAGDNIAAVEVENVLMSHPKILSAAVVPVPDQDRKEEVKAYIVPALGESSETIPPAEIIAHCVKNLADFKVPRYVEYKESFPTTPTGKIRKALILQEREDLTSGCYDRLTDE